MNWKHQKGLLALVGCILLTAGAMFCGFKLARWTLPIVIVRTEGREIISNAHAKVTDSTESTFAGFTDANDYSVEAFVRAGEELPAILESMVGEDSGHFFAYVLPMHSGFHLIIHHDNLTPDLTEEQHQRLIESLRRILDTETSKSEAELK
jgi:hypothetical protein